MKKKMTSKQALEELYVDIKQFEEHFIGCICFDSEEEYNLIKKDLEILEMFKKRMSIEVAYYNGDKRFGTYKYIEYNGTPLDIATKEEFNKIKEWLENEKQ